MSIHQFAQLSGQLVRGSYAYGLLKVCKNALTSRVWYITRTPATVQSAPLKAKILFWMDRMGPERTPLQSAPWGGGGGKEGGGVV